ncbi:chromosome segregation ATPase [cf. Phormidesmis sp. LEGE 11477]|uniref:chromosome segregation ATPase n=1 Tax=cf. Phormidesmis sp. LEGE 11477 TaxID=1828680 RepID=UPI0018808AF8|nr:chromosome segregation ATPase [cf. Phormidesmis sp. LEGE 11477]MBE9060951.1 chromosome segregation ATPase [cf. Phormidesmis sp. LEGE 11477]
MTSKYDDSEPQTGHPSTSSQNWTAAPPDQELSLPGKRSLGATLLGMGWLRSWPLVMLVIFGFLGTVGTTAVFSLFRMPSSPNCRTIFWPTASAALRLQCAETYAEKGDVKSLLAAIDLVDQLPEDHPLRQDIINRRIEDWANLLLDLAERSFEEGDIEGAIDNARKIPAQAAAASVVEERIVRWKEIWKEGADIFNTATDRLKEKNFQSAFTLSVALLDVDNQYWATEKYADLTKLISLAREDGRKLSKALASAKAGTLKGFTSALDQLEKIDEESVFYEEAQKERKEIASSMLLAGEQLLADRQLQSARAMLNAIPRDAGLGEEVADLQIFAAAYQQAWLSTIGGLEGAINQMNRLGKSRPLYGKGQRLIAQWQQEIREINLLSQARERAVRGSTADLTAAIALANQISRSSTQWEAAEKQIGEWRSRVETVQDRPILERATQLAAGGSPDNLRAAIQEARKISAKRTLGPEAAERIATWRDRIQRIEDQPLLDQARRRASAGDVAGAIAIASRIGEGRALHRTAQSDIGRWQAQETGRQRLGAATRASSRGTGEALSEAIRLAQQVPAQSDSKFNADRQINRWSWDLLREAEGSANLLDFQRAINLASQIPSQTEAYDSAQLRIQSWQERTRQPEGISRPTSNDSTDTPTETRPPLGGNGFPLNLEQAQPPNE